MATGDWSYKSQDRDAAWQEMVSRARPHAQEGARRDCSEGLGVGSFACNVDKAYGLWGLVGHFARKRHPQIVAIAVEWLPARPYDWAV